MSRFQVGEVVEGVDSSGTFSPRGWVVLCHSSDPLDDELQYWDDNRVGFIPMVFRNKVEAESVSRYLESQGYSTDESICNLPDADLRRLMCEGLAW